MQMKQTNQKNPSVKLRTRTLKIFARRLQKHYPVVQQLTLSMPDYIDAAEYIGWVGTILKLMTLCEADGKANEFEGG